MLLLQSDSSFFAYATYISICTIRRRTMRLPQFVNSRMRHQLYML